MIYVAADHAGFAMKEFLIKKLATRAVSYEDLGTFNDKMVDFPVYAKRVTEEIAKHHGTGILICGTGAGMAMSANRQLGIRAAQAWNEEVARRIREEDDANILCLPARIITNDEAWKVTSTFLSTTFTGLDRYKRRIREIDER